MIGRRKLMLVILVATACTGATCFAQQAQPTGAKKPEVLTNSPPRASKERTIGPFSLEDRQKIFELIRTVFTNAPLPVTVRLSEGPTANTVIVLRSARRDGYEVIAETITLVKSKNGWKIKSIAR